MTLLFLRQGFPKQIFPKELYGEEKKAFQVYIHLLMFSFDKVGNQKVLTDHENFYIGTKI